MAAVSGAGGVPWSRIAYQCTTSDGGGESKSTLPRHSSKTASFNTYTRRVTGGCISLLQYILLFILETSYKRYTVTTSKNKFHDRS
jgi:hypothetical protein